jgi:hypothetical protein
MDGAQMAYPTIHTPAHYVIEVYGELDPSWSDEMAGLHIERIQRQDGAWITRLSGRLVDQTALAGILYHLHLLRFTILTLQRTTDDSKRALAIE